MLTVNIDTKRVETDALNRVIHQLNLAIGEQITSIVSIRLISRPAMRQLNKTYAGKDESTDVLSFNYQESGEALDDQTLGDVVINLEDAKQQASESNTSQATELALLSLHGILHLLGYDHATKSDRVKMDDLQAKIMLAAGLEYRDFGWLK